MNTIRRAKWPVAAPPRPALSRSWRGRHPGGVGEMAALVAVVVVELAEVLDVDVAALVVVALALWVFAAPAVVEECDVPQAASPSAAISAPAHAVARWSDPNRTAPFSTIAAPTRPAGPLYV